MLMPRSLAAMPPSLAICQQYTLHICHRLREEGGLQWRDELHAMLPCCRPEECHAMPPCFTPCQACHAMPCSQHMPHAVAMSPSHAMPPAHHAAMDASAWLASYTEREMRGGEACHTASPSHHQGLQEKCHAMSMGWGCSLPSHSSCHACCHAASTHYHTTMSCRRNKVRCQHSRMLLL